MANYDAEIRVHTSVDNSSLKTTNTEIDNLKKKADEAATAVDKVGGTKIDDSALKAEEAELERLAELAHKAVQDPIAPKVDDTELQTCEVDFERLHEASVNAMKEIEAMAGTSNLYTLDESAKEVQGDFTGLQFVVKDLSKQLKDLESQGYGFGDKEYDEAYEGWKNATTELEQYKKSLDEETVQKASGTPQEVTMPTATTEEVSGGIDFSAVASSAAAVTAALKTAYSAAKRVTKEVNNIVSAFKKATTAAIKLAQSGFEKLKNAAASFIQKLTGIKLGTNYLEEFSNRVVGLVKRIFIFSIVAKAFRAMVNGIGDSFNEFTKYNSSLNSSVSSLVNAMQALRNALVSAFAPVINVCIPYITTLINYITSAVNKFGMLIAALSGKSTYTKLISSNVDYAKSLDAVSDSAKKATSNLASFDEINVLSKEDSSSSSGSSSDDGTSTEEVPISSNISDMAKKIKDAIDAGDWYKLGYDLAQKIADMLYSIPWDDIQKRATELGDNLAELLNGVFANLELATALGHTIAQALNAALDFAYAFLRKFDFEQFGIFIGTMLNEAMYEIDWQKLADTIDAGINGAILAAIGGIETFDWGFFGKAIGDTLQKSLTGIDWENMAGMITEGVHGIDEALWGINSTINFGDIAAGIVDGMNSVINGFNFKNGQLVSIEDVWSENGTEVGALVQNFLNGIFTVVDGLNWSGLGKDIAKWFNNAVAQIDWQEAGQIINKGCMGLIDFFKDGIANIDWAQLVNSINDFIDGLDWDAISKNIGELVESATSHIDYVLDNTDLMNTVGDVLATGLELAADLAWERFKLEVEAKFDAAGKIFEDAVLSIDWGVVANILTLGLYGTLVDAWDSASAWVQEVTPQVREWGSNFANEFSEGLSEAWTAVTDFFTESWEGLQEIIATGMETITTAWDEGWQAISDFFTNLWNGIVEFFTSIWDSITTTVQTVLINIQTAWNTGWTTVKTFGENIWNSIKTTVSTTFTTIKDTLSKTLDAIKEKWESVWQGMKDFVKSIINGIIDGIQTMIDAIASAINGIVDAINSIKFTNPFSGGEVGFNLNHVSCPSLPHLANGAVISGGNPFLAMLGDQPAGQTNIETPLDTMVQAFKQAMSDSSTNGINTVILQVNGSDLAKATLDDYTSEINRRGISVDTIFEGA